MQSLLHPQLGAAGQPYARTVKPTKVQPVDLPDPGLLFDCLLRRKEPKEHPAQISSVLFYLATIIIHDIFRTDHVNFAYCKTSSYLDLAPLYGSTEPEQATVRTFKDGKLQPDCFAETRLLMLPPGSGILLIMFNRFHNHVAEQLVTINENGRFSKPRTDTKEAWEKYDNEIFQTARLITCGLYVNIILIDYVRTILNLNRTDSDWQLNPRIQIQDGPEMGVGNQVSAEFNLVYRWHATISTRDEQWTLDEFATIFGKDRKPDEIPMGEFLKALQEIEKKFEKQTPMERQFAKFKRQPNGYYSDDDLVASISQSADDCANAYGPRQTPAVMRGIEILGMIQSRTWNLATLNEFRKHFSLKPHEKWEDITTDPQVAADLKHLYKHVDNVELYPGLVVEDAKVPMVPGSGLCPSFTVSRAVLSDAVALVRGDRFYTTSYHPRILTSWGFAEAGCDTSVDNGCVLYKLFQRAYPRHFDPDSIYTHFPLTQATAVKNDVLRHHLPHKAHLYDTNSVNIKARPDPYIVRSQDVMQQALSQTDGSIVDLTLATRLLCPERQQQAQFSSAVSTQLTKGGLFHTIPNNVLSELCASFELALEQHIKESSYNLSNFREINIVEEVICKTAARLSIKLFDIPCGGEGRCNETELQDLFGIVAATWTNFDRTTLTALRQKATVAAKKLRKSMLPDFEDLAHKWSKHGDLKFSHRDGPLKLWKLDFLSNIFTAGMGAEQAYLATIVLASSFATSVSQHASEIVASLLQQSNNSHMSAIRALATDSSASADTNLTAKILELTTSSSEAIALRILTQPTTLADTILPAGAPLLLSARILNASSPATPTPLDLAFDSAGPAWQTLQLAALKSLLRVVAHRMPGLRAATTWVGGRSGPSALRKVPIVVGGESEGEVVQYSYLNERWDRYTPVPTSESSLASCLTCH